MTAVLRMAAVLASVIAIVARDGSANSEELAGRRGGDREASASIDRG